MGQDSDGIWRITKCVCTNDQCKKVIVELVLVNPKSGKISQLIVNPRASNRPISPLVPKIFATDFIEACIVLPDSAKASAALSRRCLQNLLREVAKVKQADLYKEIQDIIDSRTLPSYLSENLDAIRVIGNFAAHPTKSTNSGEIIEVEPGEAEWNLDVLEGLFDFYFVQPTLMKKKKDALNKKLGDAGKPPIK